MKSEIAATLTVGGVLLSGVVGTFAYLHSDIKDLGQEIRAVRTDLGQEIRAVRTDLGQRISKLDDRLNSLTEKVARVEGITGVYDLQLANKLKNVLKGSKLEYFKGDQKWTPRIFINVPPLLSFPKPREAARNNEKIDVEFMMFPCRKTQ